MKFVEVNEVPKRAAKHNLKDDLERFVQSGANIIRIDFHEGEYKSAGVAARCLAEGIKRHHFTNVRVFKRGNNIYLEKTM